MTHAGVMKVPVSGRTETPLTGAENSKEEAKEAAEVKTASVKEKAIDPSDTETGEKQTGIQEVCPDIISSKQVTAFRVLLEEMMCMETH